MASIDAMDAIREEFPDILYNCAGFIRIACRQAKISPQTYYNWKAAYPDFALKCQDSIELAHDVLESVLVKMCKDQDLAAIKYYFPKRLKHRGYGENREEENDNNLKELSAIDMEIYDRNLQHKISQGVEAELKRLGIVPTIEVEQTKEVISEENNEENISS